MLTLLALVVLVAAGCGDPDTIDAGKVENHIRDQARVPRAIEEIVCPEDVEVDKGKTFDCKIVAKDGSEEAVTIRQEDDDASIRIVGNRQTKLPADSTDVTIVPENVEQLIRSAAPGRERITSVDCPSDVKLKQGDRFGCVVTFDDKSEEVVTIVQRDRLGNVEIAGSRERP